ncbi:hypothetical protein HYV49_00410 [Candidatus Pacearchaeota archaeon]|nr:hypothetical protein [Candidatus Pacearchaeota archaeon]
MHKALQHQKQGKILCGLGYVTEELLKRKAFTPEIEHSFNDLLKKLPVGYINFVYFDNWGKHGVNHNETY